jgi:hypothetical protein
MKFYFLMVSCDFGSKVITITDHKKQIIYSILYHKGPETCQFNHINQMITSSVITLSGLYCDIFQTNLFQTIKPGASMVKISWITPQ